MGNGAEQGDGDAVSLSDLPLLHSQANGAENSVGSKLQNPDDFEFGSVLGESQMCTADEVFFQGRIVPFRHSFSSGDKSHSRPVSRSHSLDHSVISSRTSNNYALRPPRTWNQLLSHPSPSPRIRESIRWNLHQPQKPSSWNIFRLGLFTPPPELTFQDFKPRHRNRISGSRNSTSSRGSSASSVRTKKIRATFLPGCRYCSIDAVDTLASTSRVMIFRRERDGGEIEQPAIAKKAAVKTQLTRQRTLEWIKHLP